MIRRTTCLAICLLFFTPAFYAQQPSSGIALVTSERPYGDRVAAMAMDRAGYVWTVGIGPSGLPTSPDAFKRTSPGQGAVLQRIAPDGSLSYLTYLGTFNATGIALDTADNIYITGSAQLPQDLSATPGAFDPLCDADGTCQFSDAVVMKLAAGGRSLVYATYLGGGSFDYGQAIAVDAAGHAHVSGKTSSLDFPLTSGAVRTALTGGRTQDAFYARLSADGSRLEYSTYIGGSDMDDGTAVAADAAGRAYVAGWTASQDFTLKNANNSTANPPNGFLARFSAGGLDFSTFIGGADSEQVAGVALSPTAVYVAGHSNSADLSSAPRDCVTSCSFAAFVTKVAFDGTIGPTTLLDGGQEESAGSIAVDANDVVYFAGFATSRDFPVTLDAAQITPAGSEDAIFAVIPMTGESAGRPSYATYLGGSFGDWALAAVADRSGGAWIGGTSPSPDFPRVNAKQEGGRQAWIAHFAQTGQPPPASSDIVLYARDVSSVAGNWDLVPDATAAGGTRIWNPDGGVQKLPVSAAPASFFELTFHAEAGVRYHLWLRMKADGDSWTNDSVNVQFSDSADAFGNPAWRIGTTSAAMVSLEDCTGCGEHAWGWNDNGYDRPGDLVTFGTTGMHTIRIQQREDGVSIDQVVLSTRTYINTAPGAGREDATILPPSDGTPLPPSDPKEIVMHVARERLEGGANWLVTSDGTAAGGARLFNPDHGAPKAASAVAAYPDYFEVQFTAQAGVPYHLWVRARAQGDHYGNDSVFLQFSDSVDRNGSANLRIGTTSATNVILEDCGGCGEQGWGWTDNAYDAFAAPIYFARSGPQTVRVTRREDGMSIDQIVLSAARYFAERPGAVKNDTSIVPK